MEDKKDIKLDVKRFNENHQFANLGKPKELKPGIYGVKKTAVVGRIYAINCPKCDRQLLLKAKSSGVFRVTCPGCKTPVIYRASDRNDAVTTEKTEKVNLPNKVTERIRVGRKQHIDGKLVWGGLFNRKTYTLHEGENYIGREDQDAPSDVSIKDDYASRRSVKIDVLPGNKGYSYKLTILKATNSILVNGQSLSTGNSLYLNYGDTIVLGNTTLIFKKAKK